MPRRGVSSTRGWYSNSLVPTTPDQYVPGLSPDRATLLREPNGRRLGVSNTPIKDPRDPHPLEIGTSRERKVVMGVHWGWGLQGRKDKNNNDLVSTVKGPDSDSGGQRSVRNILHSCPFTYPLCLERSPSPTVSFPTQGTHTRPWLSGYPSPEGGPWEERGVSKGAGPFRSFGRKEGGPSCR